MASQQSLDSHIYTVDMEGKGMNVERADLRENGTICYAMQGYTSLRTA